MTRDVSFEYDLNEAVSKNSLPRRYYSHPDVKAAPAGVVYHPYSIFVDGVKYKKHDSTVAVLVFSLITLVRHLLVCIKKAELCQCGCRGWCTWHRIFSFLAWTIDWARQGLYAFRKHDGSDWEADSPYATLAGSRISHPCVLVHIKADWGEYAPTIGLPTWSSATNPCKDCTVDKARLSHIEESYAEFYPYDITTARDYDVACRLCEIRVQINSREDHARIRAALWFDKRRHGHAGRCIRRAYPEFGLEVGDRLEPSVENPDILEFDDWVDFPRHALFWRPSRESMARHRNPLFSVRGVTHKSITVDILHAVYLGVAQVWILGAFWKIMDDNAFHVVCTDRGTRDVLSAARIRIEIMEWYAETRKTQHI